MARRRENMLEAFQASTERDEGPPGQPGSPASPPGGAGVGAPDPRRAGVHRGPLSEGVTLPLGTVPFLFLQIALLVLVFSIGYLAGQRSGEVQASPGGSDQPIDLITPGGPGAATAQGPARSLDPVTPPRPENRGEGGRAPDADSPAEQAFADLANRYTIVVYTAEDTDFGQQAAWVVHDYLEGAGYPVISPRHWKGEIKVFVGAAPKTALLEPLVARIRQDPGPDGAKPFYDAYVDNADRFR